jgi:hypothetical protein
MEMNLGGQTMKWANTAFPWACCIAWKASNRKTHAADSIVADYFLVRRYSWKWLRDNMERVGTDIFIPFIWYTWSYFSFNRYPPLEIYPIIFSTSL